MADDEPVSSDPESPDAPAAPPKKRMSRAVKAAFWLLGLSALCCVLCCGFLGINAGRLIQAGLDAEARSHEDSQALAQEIVPFDPPEHFVVLVTLDANLFPGGRVSVVNYDLAQGAGSMWLIRLPVSVGNAGTLFPSIRERLSQPGNAAGDRMLRDLSIEETETRAMTIRGYDTTVRLSQGTDRQSGERIRELTTAFPGRPGTTFLIVQTLDEAWNEDELIRMLETIR